MASSPASTCTAISAASGSGTRPCCVLPWRAVVEELEVLDDGDVRMLDLRGQARLAEEARAVGVVGEQRRPHDLDAAEGVEVDVTGLVDLTHPARAEEADDLVLPVEKFSGSDG